MNRFEPIEADDRPEVVEHSALPVGRDDVVAGADQMACVQTDPDAP